jgi:uncharacterized membrane protein YsdA (DUF1294 family)
MRQSAVSATARRHLVILGIVALVAIALMLIIDPVWLLPLWWLIAGIVTFAYYGYDKAQARRGGWRVPESILHLLALAGGFLGGWAGMYAFRHKTREPIFKVVLGLATVLQLGLAFWLWRS